MGNHTVILASASPRRIEMFQKNEVQPIIMPADVHETLPKIGSARDAVMYLALKKGLFIEEKLTFEEKLEKENKTTSQQENRLIISADTVVFLDDIIGKPKDEEEAFQMLKSMAGRTHFVATGVCMILTGQKRKHVFCETTEVTFGDYTDQDILDYIATGEPMDKAGAYAIQGGWKPHVKYYVGDYNNIVGFPWDRAQRECQLQFGCFI